MKNIIWIVACVVPFHAFASGDGVHITYQINSTAEDQPINGKVEYYYQDGDMLAETDFAQNPLGKMHMLEKGGKNYIIFPDVKSYMEVSDFSSILNVDDQSLDAQGDFKPTGVKKKIAGHECEVFTRKDKESVQNVCLNQPLYNQYKGVVQSMEKISQDHFSGVKGFPLEVDIKGLDSKNPFQSVTVVERIEKKNVKDRTSLPKDYKKREIPSIPQGAQDMMKKMQETGKLNSEDMQSQMEAMQKMAEEMKKKYGK